MAESSDKYARFTGINGRSVWINPDFVQSFTELSRDEEATQIQLVSAPVAVRARAAEVAAELRKVRQ